jgi:hypothetical protein
MIRYGHETIRGRHEIDHCECPTAIYSTTKQKCERIYKSLRPQFYVAGSSIKTPDIHKAIAKVLRRDGCIGMDRKVLHHRGPRRLCPLGPGMCTPADAPLARALSAMLTAMFNKKKVKSQQNVKT